MADGKFFDLKIITPDRVFYEGAAEMIELNTVEGEIGIYKEHIPLTTIIAPGILRVYEAEQTREAALHAGFVEVLKDRVTILAEIVEWPEEIDLNRAEEAKNRAAELLTKKDSSTDIARAETALYRATARIEVAKK